MKTEFSIIAGVADKLKLIIPFFFKNGFSQYTSDQVENIFHKYYGKNETLKYPQISLPYYRDKKKFRRIKNNLINLDRYDVPHIMIDGNVLYSVTEHTEDYNYHGHIDKNIHDLLVEVLLKNDITAEKFVDDDHYIMIIDGDEYDTWHDLKDNKIIDRNTIKYECDLSDVTETYTDNTTEGSTDGKDN